MMAARSRVLRALDRRGYLPLEEVIRWNVLLAQQEMAPALGAHEVSIELIALVADGFVERKTWQERWDEDFARTKENARGGPFVGDQDTRTKYALTVEGAKACERLRGEAVRT